MIVKRIEKLANGNVLLFGKDANNNLLPLKGFMPTAGITKILSNQIKISQQNGSDHSTFEWDLVEDLIGINGTVGIPPNRDAFYKLLFTDFFFYNAVSAIVPDVDNEIGNIKMHAGSSAPTGYSFCDGQTLNILDFPDLFAVIGALYGGDGLTTFALPDYRGRTLVHAGQATGLLSYVLGAVGGVESVALTEAEMPQHSHEVKAVTNPGNRTTPTGNLLANTVGLDREYSNLAGNTEMSTAMITPSGSGTAHENRQPFAVVNFIIKL